MQQPEIRIILAKYFTSRRIIDVTGIIQSKMKDGMLDIIVSNDLFGDPEEGVKKQLRINYILCGEERQLTIEEGSRAMIPNIIAGVKGNNISDSFVKKDTPIKKEVSPHTTDIIIVSYKNDSLTANCFDSIKKFTKEGTYKIIWIDNDSGDMPRSMEAIKGVNSICIFAKENMGFVGGVNEGLRISTAPAICLLNNDTKVTDRWLEKLTKSLYADKNIGIIGAMTQWGGGVNQINMDSHHSLSLNRGLIPKESLKWTITKLNAYMEKKYSGKVSDISFVAFLCALIKREVYEVVGYLDTNFKMGLWDDVDWNRSAEAHGYDVKLALDTLIYHKGRSTFNMVALKEGVDVNILHDENKMYLDKKWAGWEEKRNYKY